MLHGSTSTNRAVRRSENPGVPVLFGGHNLSPYLEIGLTDLPKYGGAMAPLTPPGTTYIKKENPTSVLILGPVCPRDCTYFSSFRQELKFAQVKKL